MGLEEHRSKVDEIDEKIIRLIDKRIDFSKKIFEAKKSEGKDIEDPVRKSQVLRKTTDLAKELNLDALEIEKIFNILIYMSTQKQKELQGGNQG